MTPQSSTPARTKTPPPPLGRTFANLFTANVSSSLGDGIARTAIPLLAVQVTHDPLLISGISALAMLPWLFFAIPAGILIDRIDRRAALSGANTVRTLLAAALFLLTWTGSLTIWWLFLITFVFGMFETVYDGAIRAVVPSIVVRTNLPRANSRIEAGEQVVQNLLAGPFTSLLFAVSVLIPLGANVATYLLAVILALLLPRAASGRQYTSTVEKRPPWHRQFVDGYRFIMADRMFRTLWFFSVFTGLCFSTATSIFVLYLLQRLGLPEAWFGVFLLSGAAGGLLATVVTAPLKARLGSGLAMALSTVVTDLAIILLWAVQTIWAAALGFVISSLAITVWNILVMSLRQSIVPGRLLGRVHGTWRTLLWGATPVGSVLGGLIGRIDLALPFLIGGGASLVSSVIFFRFLTRLPDPEDIVNGDEAEPEHVPSPTVTDPLLPD